MIVKLPSGIFASALCAILISICAYDECDAEPQAEAKTLIQKQWHDTIIKCGDDYYWRMQNHDGDADTIYELKGVTFDFKWGKLTEADKLNGLEWSATSDLTYKFFRARNSSWPAGQWGDWAQWEPQFHQGSPGGVSVIKRSGTATAEMDGVAGPHPDCADVAKQKWPGQ